MRLLVCRIFAKRETGDRYFNFRIKQRGMRNTVIIAMQDRMLSVTLGTQCATTCKEKQISELKHLNLREVEFYLFKICCSENYVNTTKSKLCNTQEKIDQLPILSNIKMHEFHINICEDLLLCLPCKITVRNQFGRPCLAGSFHNISIVHKMAPFSLFHDCSTFDLITFEKESCNNYSTFSNE